MPAGLTRGHFTRVFTKMWTYAVYSLMKCAEQIDLHSCFVYTWLENFRKRVISNVFEKEN